MTPDESRNLAPPGCGLKYMEIQLVIDQYRYFMGGEEQLNESLEQVQGRPLSLAKYLRRVSGFWDSSMQVRKE